jgi:hypothetical protein
MKKAVIAIVLGASVFTAIYGLAASLGVSSGTLGAGNTTVAACQSGTLSVSYSPSFSSGSYKATTVTIGSIDTATTACGDKSIKVSLTGSAGQLAEQTGTTPTSGTSMNLTFSSVEAADVTGVHVVIVG